MGGTPRILHIHFGKEGGAERFFVNLARGLAERGADQRFVVRGTTSWAHEVEALGPTIHAHGRPASPGTLIARLRVRHLCRTWRPDLILAWMPRAARQMPAWPQAVRATRLGDFPANLKHFDRTDVLIGNVPEICRRAVALGWSKPTRVISNFSREVTPVPVPRASLGTPEDAFLVTAGGRFVPRKGLDVAMRAVAQLPDAWLWLLGDGRLRGDLEALAEELGIAGRVRFAGWTDEPIHHMAASDAFVMASRVEPLGNMLLEAWRAGVPSVSTRSEGPDWYMRGGQDGVLVEIDDVDAVAEGLRRIRDEPATRAAFVASAHERSEGMFGRDAVIDAYLALAKGTPPGK